MRRASLASLKASIEKYVTEWFNLTLSTDDKAADIVISDETAFLSSAGSNFRSQIILCSNGARRSIYMSRLEPGQAVEFVSKPCGPHRIAKALLNCLDTEEVIHKSDINRVSPPYGANYSSIIARRKNAMVTAGTSSNKRLIGHLEPSIGFSPRTSDPSKYGSYSKPKFSRSIISSSSVLSITDLNLDISRHSSRDSSIGSVAEETPKLEKTAPDVVEQATPPTPGVRLVSAMRKPKMLLVEVGIFNQPKNIV